MKKEPAKSMTKNDRDKLSQLEVKITPMELDEDGYEISPSSVKVNDKGKALLEATGTLNEELAQTTAGLLMASLPTHLQKDKTGIKGALAMLCGINPQDELEGALAAQMVAIHYASLEMMRRAMHENQTVEGTNEAINRAVKLSRTFALQMEVLQKYRTKGQQMIQVQHVQVNEGGQAIVGNVKTGGGGNG